MTSKTQFPRLCAMFAMLAVAGAAQAQSSADKPAPSRPAKTISQPHNKTTDSIQRGTDAAGRGVANADHAARRGIDQGSEAASRPVRNLGDSLGRKLGLGPTRSAPRVGPQGESP